ncbi:MAG: hypothetical protein EXR31_05605 [Betaproteobacteria bacterium]|nr:hypothetical protein [Betaproteobacteria bacterium]
MDWQNETLRFPTNLDRDAIIKRLVKTRELAVERGFTELAAKLDGVETMPGPKIGIAVITAISLPTETPEHKALLSRLEMLAVNLKNL